ncbi:MAG: AI-2E family transporter [Nocardioides sp.]
MTDGEDLEERVVQEADRAEQQADRAEDAAERAEDAVEEVQQVVEEIPDDETYLHGAESSPDDLGSPSRPFNKRSPFLWGFLATWGGLLAWFLGRSLLQIGSVLILVVVAMFLAVGLNPVVELFMRRGVRRSWSVALVIIGVLIVLTLFVVAIAPVVTDQINNISDSLPQWFRQLQRNGTVRDLDQKYDLTHKLQDYIQSGGLAQKAFGGVLGFGLAVLGFLANTFVVLVLTLYFLASLPSIKGAAYSLAPASRRERVSLLGDRVLRNIGGYVSGAFVVALCAGVTTLVFLFVVGLSKYAVALALIVALLDVIPMIGATIGAVIVCAIAFATDPTIGFICVVFYIAYQQLENYLIYPKVMSRSVEIPGALTVIAALVGASLLGVVGALLAIPTAASIMLLVKEVYLPRQETR